MARMLIIIDSAKVSRVMVHDSDFAAIDELPHALIVKDRQGVASVRKQKAVKEFITDIMEKEE